jgi:peptide/nickel transport system permease protein
MPEPLASPLGDQPLPTASLAATVAPAAEPVDVAPTRKLGFLGWFSIAWMVLIIGLALLAPILPLDDPNETFGGLQREPPPQPGHILGGDSGGHDMLSRVIFGARTSLLVGFGAVAFGWVIGGFLGLLAGYFKGRVDTVLSTFFNVLLSIPALVLALSLVAVFASADENASNATRVRVLIIALGVVSVPILGRITRASTLSWSEREFVKAAQVSGAKPLRVIFREVFPNVLPAMMSIALLGVAVVIVAEGSLSLLGVGVQDVPTWGNMIDDGRSGLRNAPHMVFIPSTAIFFTVLSLNYLGDVVRARFDVRESML